MKNKILLFTMAMMMLLGVAGTALAQEKTVDAYFFYGDTCPHCHEEAEFLDKLTEELSYLEVHKFEVYRDYDNGTHLMNVGKELQVSTSAVPILFIGEKHFIGFANEETTGKAIRETVEDCWLNGCEDLVKPIIYGKPVVKGVEIPEPGPDDKLALAQIEDNGQATEPGDVVDETGQDEAEPIVVEPVAQVESDEKQEQSKSTNGYSDKIHLPFIGETDIKSFSLPALTVVIAALDGFNPCAMWVLLFLISLLLGMKNRKRMWILGSAFIVASGFVYFLFLAAWLNVILFLGLITWVRLSIGLVAVASGIYNLREYWLNRDGCKVTDGEKRQRIFGKLRDITQKKQFWLALGGIILLAMAVNLVELVCSAGLPAVYTSVLALSDLPAWQNYLYFLLYIVIFMLDDLIVFIIAMTTLRMVGLSSKYSRYSSLIGGILILIVGLMLIFRPEWLMFA